MMTQKFV